MGNVFLYVQSASLIAYPVVANAKSQELKFGDSLSFSKKKTKKRGRRKEKEEDKYIRKQAAT